MNVFCPFGQSEATLSFCCLTSPNQSIGIVMSISQSKALLSFCFHFSTNQKLLYIFLLDLDDFFNVFDINLIAGSKRFSLKKKSLLDSFTRDDPSSFGYDKRALFKKKSDEEKRKKKSV